MQALTRVSGASRVRMVVGMNSEVVEMHNQQGQMSTPPIILPHITHPPSGRTNIFMLP